MSDDNVIPFRKAVYPDSDEPLYVIEVWPGEEGFEWALGADTVVDEQMVAGQLETIARSLRPQQTTFFRRLKALFQGDDR